MDQSYYKDLPIRHKVAIAQELGEALHLLHTGQRGSLDLTLEEMKAHSLYLEEPIQQAVLAFAETVQFQTVYDPWHRVTPEVRRAADRLIDDMGFCAPPPT